MPALSNAKHERFARLLVQGITATEAVRKVYPEASSKSSIVMGSRLKHSLEIASRVAEMKEIIDSQFAMTTGERRDALRRMGAGEIPTKVTRRANGKIEATYDRLAALQLDARLAGELGGDTTINMHAGPTLKLDFHVLGRNTSMTPELEAEWQELNKPQTRELPEPPPEQEDDFSLYEQADINPNKSMTLDQAAQIIDISTEDADPTE
jgi:hypothetical protein